MDLDQFYDADASPASADFLPNDAEYYHHESVARCVNAAIRSNATHHDDFLTFNSNDPFDTDKSV